MGKSKKSRKKRKKSKGQDDENGSNFLTEHSVQDGTSDEPTRSDHPVVPPKSSKNNNDMSNEPSLSSRKKKKKKRRRNSDDNKSQLASKGSSDVTTLSPGKKRKRSDGDTLSSSPGSDGTLAATTTTTTPGGEAASAAAPVFPYPVGEDDHCESPLEAYQDILPLLQYLQRTMMTSSTTTPPPGLSVASATSTSTSRRHGNSNNKSDDGICIYDPYFCNGAVVRHLAGLGFPNVYNEKEDCYKVWSDDDDDDDNNNNKKYPSFDILVTNPPYSEDHIEKLMQHVTSSSSTQKRMRGKPWFLLLPNWVHKKDYFTAACARHDIRPFYLVPRKRYVYLPPKDFRASKKSDVHKKSSPFVSMWYVYGGTPQRTEKLIQHWLSLNNKKGSNNSSSSSSCDLARSKSALRDLRRKKR